MIINEDSPLRRLPAEMDGRQALFFDAIRFAIEMADFSHTRLRGTLQSLATTLGTDSPMHAETPAALADAWSIVDSVHRLRCLIEQVPGLSKRQRWPAIAVFDRETAAIEDLRNTVQHLTSEIPAIAEANWPVWGILHWVVLDEGRASARICTLVAGRIAPRSHPLLEPGGRPMYECDMPIGRITLAIHNAEVCLSDAMEHVRRVASELEDAMRAQQGDVPTTGSDVLIRVDIDFTG